MPPKTSRTCDNCRKRKVRRTVVPRLDESDAIYPVRSTTANGQIKCVEDDTPGAPETKPCIGCRNLAIDCTYDYVKKKPGRKNA